MVVANGGSKNNFIMKKKLIFIGDSLTEFYDWEARFPEYEVLNLGISGERTEELLERMPRERSKLSAADFVFIMTGINNIAMEDFNILGPYSRIVEMAKKELETSTVVVQSVLPVFLYWIDNRLIRSLNTSLKDLCSRYNVEYLDIYSSFVNSGDKVNRLLLLEDGIHISDKGYEVWSNVVERYLREKTTFSR